MVRSYWKGALVLALAWAGAVRGQQPQSSSPSTGQTPERLMTVQEPGKLAQQCRVLSSRSLPDGGTALKLQTLASGETFTIVEGPGSSGGVRQVGGQSISVAIDGDTAHPVKPAPLKTAPVSAAPAAAGGCGCGDVSAIRTLQEPGRPPMRCRLLRRWHTSANSYACEMQCMDNGEMVTVLEDGPATTMPDSRFKAVATRIFHWGRYQTPPPGAPVPPSVVISETVVAGPMPVCSPYAPVVVQGMPMEQGSVVVMESAPEKSPGFGQRLVGRIQGMFSCKSPPAQPIQVAETVVAPPPVAPKPEPIKTAQAAPPARSTAEAAPPTDWRKSWDAPSTPAQAAKPAVVAQAPPPPAPINLPRPPASVTATERDPLFRPDAAISRSAEQKMNMRNPAPPARFEAKPTAPPPAAPVASMPLEQGKVPLGAQSVIAASNGLDNNVRYIPVPIVTVPDSKRLPLPPVPQIPQAPQPNSGLYQNAFAPPTPPPGTQPGAPMMGQQAMLPGYAPMMPPPGMMPGQTMMPPGYPQMMPPGRNPMPGYGMVPGIYPYPPPGMPMQPPGRGTVPYAYQGPMPPNPFAAPAMQRGYGQAAMQAGQPRNVAMDRPAVAPAMSAAQASTTDQIMEMVTVLKTSSYPSQREWAANNLGTFDWHSHPVVVEALVSAAREDPAATVRSGCAYTLGRMHATSAPVLATLRQLKDDRDPRVRADAEKALARLNADAQPGTATAGDPNPVQPVRATQPGRP